MNPLRPLDRFLNSITMYRLALYGLSLLTLVSIIFGFLHLVSFSGLTLIVSLVVLLASCYLSNLLLAHIFHAPRNVESAWITGFILFFILQPSIDRDGILVLIAGSLIAMGSKYVLTIGKKHVFNPAAIGALVLGLSGIGAAIWWIATPSLFWPVLIVGLLIVRKIRRFALFIAFAVTGLIVLVVLALNDGLLIGEVLKQAFISWPLIFFGTIMLTEPLTSPSTRKLQIIYGIVVGILFSSQFSIGPVAVTPELSLIIGNIFSFFVSSRQKLVLALRSSEKLSPFIYSFSFSSDEKLSFRPGQYLEWTLPHNDPDSRGNRRYFTIASSPTESDISIGVRIQENGSSFKRALLGLKKKHFLVASQVSGEFVLPKDMSEKLVFIAGGIGITPFRSMIKYLADSGQKMDIILLYACATENDFVYKEVFEEAQGKFDLKVHYIVTDAARISEAWKGKTGFITSELIEKDIPDFGQRIFYLSGPEAMVSNYKKLILGMKVSRKNIRTDYFPGF